MTIAIGDGRVFFIDSSITREERDALLRQDKTALQALSPAEAAKKEAELKKLGRSVGSLPGWGDRRKAVGPAGRCH